MIKDVYTADVSSKSDGNVFKRVKGRSRRRKGKEKGKRERKREEIEKDPTCGEVFGLLLLLEEARSGLVNVDGGCEPRFSVTKTFER